MSGGHMTTLVLALGWRPTWVGTDVAGSSRGRCDRRIPRAGGAGDRCVGAAGPRRPGGSWTVWLLWLGAVFPHSRERVHVPLADLPYRRAFLSEILPGIGWSFAQLARPAFEGLSRGRPFADGATLIAGLPWCSPERV